MKSGAAVILKKTVWSALIVLCAVSLVLTACATVSMNDTWLDPNFKPRSFKNFLVVGITKDPNVRRVFEDIFTAELRNRGVKAVASYTVTPQDQQITKDILVAAVKTTGSDAVITTRVVSIQKQSQVVPGYVDSYGAYPYPYMLPQRDLYNYYGYYGGPTVVVPPTVQTYEVATLETVLFDVADAAMVWSASSTTFETGQIMTVSKDLSKLIIKQLREKKLL